MGTRVEGGTFCCWGVYLELGVEEKVAEGKRRSRI